MKKYARVALALMILLVGCSTSSGPRTESNTKLFSAPANRALIFIYRDDSQGLREKVLPTLVTVSVNGHTLGQTTAKSYFRLNVKPGNYAINSLAGNVAALNLTVEAGKIYYVHQDISSWSLSPEISLQQVDDNTGRKNVFESRIIPSNIPDRMLSDAGTPSVTQTEASVADKLRELQDLKKDGLISEEEFLQKRQQLIEKL